MIETEDLRLPDYDYLTGSRYMELAPVRLEDLTNIKCSYQLGVLPKSKAKVLVMRAAGIASNQVNSDFDSTLGGYIVAGLEAWRCDALILDFRNLEYEWGDTMLWVLDAGIRWFDYSAPPNNPRIALPTALVVSGINREGLTSLIKCELFSDPSDWLYESIDEAACACDKKWLQFRAANKSW